MRDGLQCAGMWGADEANHRHVHEHMDRATRRVDVIINVRSGVPGKPAAADQVSQYFASRGIMARVDLVRPENLKAAAERAATGDADVVVAGGGDGTLATIASSIIDTSKLFGVLPLGTFNYFAQRIGLPPGLDAALDVIATSTTARTMSVGDVNGRVFLNNSSIGLYPAVLKKRESTYRQIGRSQAAAYLSVARVLLQLPGLLDLQLTADGVPIDRRTPLLFVGVNPHQMATFGIEGHQCPEEGRLAAYITRPLTASAMSRLAVRAFFQGLHGAAELEVLCARELSVTLRRKRIRVAMDGEITRLQSPLRYQLRVNALRVLAPEERDQPPVEA